MENILNHIITTIKSITLKETALFVQMGFYIIGATVAIFTYRSAKRGLLNTVHTEYQKRVMDHLERLSETLYFEFDSKSENNFSYNSKGRENLNEIIRMRIRAMSTEVIFKGESYIYKPEESFHITTKLEDNLKSLKNEIESHPFLPAPIVKNVVKHLEDRLKALTDAKFKALNEVCVYLNEKKLPAEKLRDDSQIEVISSIFINTILKELKAKGYDNDQVQMKVKNIRLMIREHLESFNPFSKR
ncbi:hypothetical protein [Priestia megaterium]|uniref:hypothetical protein n=1 Tax=Priestia megaterium TaxID=1404 RepID=UPI002E1B0FA4|nr:hypothetical protein [Priestia megaterium]